MSPRELTLPDALTRARAALGGGRLREVEALCRAILRAEPASFDALDLLARAQVQGGRTAEALAAVDRALVLRPGEVEAHFLRAGLLRRLDRRPEALVAYSRTIELHPGHAEALHDRAMTLREMGRLTHALADCDRALAVRPDYGEAAYLQAVILRSMNRWREAVASFARAVNFRPAYAAARFGRCIGELPILYMDAAEIDERRAAYEHALRDFCDVAASDPTAGLADGIGSFQPFFLAYQGRNDRALQSLYGTTICALAAKRYGAATVAPSPAPHEPIRVGIVSGYFRAHSNWKQPISGWLDRLDRRRFEIYGYYTGALSDSATDRAAASCRRFVRGPLSPAQWRREIAHDAPHVLIYPEIGMDPAVPALAAQRLAATQCTFWGHPETSGMPTVDYFLSSDLMEPPDGEAHYTERLVRLPNLSIYYEPIEAQSTVVDRAKFGLREGAVVYWCSQSIFKYLPQFDDVFPRIARDAGDCQFAFVQGPGQPHVGALFWIRLSRAFARNGLKIDDHCMLLPRLSSTDYGAVTGLCDVFLDSIGWSGGNTTLESLAHDLPIVTLPGTVMRARHSAAILRRMGIADTIATDIDDYVRLAVRLARDKAWRSAMATKIAANKHLVYRDHAAIEGLERFLEQVARPA